MTRRRQDTLLWLAALVLGVAAMAGAAVLHGQMVVTQTGAGGMQIGGSDRPLETGTGIILGRAIDAGSSRPVPGAIVILTVAGFAPVRVMADSQGQFAFRDLPVGRFNVSASKPGYVDGSYGRMRPGGQALAIDLTAGQHVADASVPMWKFGAITGRVIDESGDPVIGAMVRVLRRTVVAGRRQLTMGSSDNTDDRGIFRLGSLEPGEYVVVVPMTQRPNVPGWVGAESLLQAAGLPRDLLSSVPSGGGGGGSVMFSARIDTGSGSGPIIIDSNDMGVAPAGTTADGHTLTYQTEFYPASSSASRATAVTIASGDERGGVDFQLKPVRTVTVSGSVTSPDSNPAELSLSLIPADADELVTPIETATTRTDGTGAFRFVNVPPGQYSIRALRSPAVAREGTTTMVMSQGVNMTMAVNTVRVAGPGSAPVPPLPTTPTLWADVSVSIGNNDVSDLTVPLRQGLRVSGRVDFAGSAERPAADQLPAIGVSLEPADGRTSSVAGGARGRVEPSGSFQTIGVAPGKYVLRVSAPRGWLVRGATFNGQDVIDTAVELRDGDAAGVVITFVDRPADLSGTVTGANGAPDGTASVIAFPVDRALWAGAGPSPRRLKNVRTGKDGAYSLGNLPAGEYYVVAVPDAAAGDWQNPAFLDAVSRNATRVRVDEGEKRTQALQTARVQ